VERLAAVAVLSVGAVLLLATGVSVALGVYEHTVWKDLVTLLIVVGMWRAVGHLRPPLPAR
jgi:hypothetical protein